MNRQRKPTILRGQDHASSIETEGKVRAGMPVLKRAVLQHEQAEKAKQVYSFGIQNERTFRQIEHALQEKLGIKGGVIPYNPDHFIVKGVDWPTREQAARLLELYGEDRGEGRKLYRFPVVFPVDDIDQLVPHQLRCWSYGGLKYWSDFEFVGEHWERCCYRLAEVPVDPKAKRAKRIFGGRETRYRDDSHIQRLCVPDACPEYQAGDCNLQGSILAYIPGVSGSHPCRIIDNSIYSLKLNIAKLEDLQRVRPLTGFANGKPWWWVSKAEREISRIDTEGKAKRQKQILIQLTADVDLLEEIRQLEQQRGLGDGRRAAATLEGPAKDPAPVQDPVQDPATETDHLDISF